MRAWGWVFAVGFLATACGSNDDGKDIDLTDCNGACSFIKGCCPDLDTTQCVSGCGSMFSQPACNQCAEFSGCAEFVQCAYEHCGMPTSACSNIPPAGGIDLSDCDSSCAFVKGCCPNLDLVQCKDGCTPMFSQPDCNRCATETDCPAFVLCAFDHCGMPRESCPEVQ